MRMKSRMKGTINDDNEASKMCLHVAKAFR